MCIRDRLKTLTRGSLIALGNEILAAKLKGIDIELTRHFVDVRLQGKHGLRLSGCTHEAAWDGIGVDKRRRDLAMRRTVGTSRLVIAVDEAAWFEGCIGPRIDQVVHLVSDECPVTLHTTLEVHLDCC